MTRDEFMSAAADLVGGGHGMFVRLSRSLGFSEGTLHAINAGRRPVPAFYVERLTEALAVSEDRGRCYSFMVPRVEQAIQAAERAGWRREDALAALAAWAGLELSRAVSKPSQRSR